MPYHVTKRQNGIQIWNDRTIQSKDQGRHKRKKMRQHIDKLGNKQQNTWVNRTNAVFAWSTFSRAKRYSERFTDPAVVELNCSGSAWCVQNHIIEDVYREYSSEIDEKFIQQVVNRAEEWHGKRDNEIEVWMQPEAVGDIHGVYDQFGDPLQ